MKQGGLFNGESDDRASRSHADVEPDSGNAPLGAKKTPRLNPPFRITFRHIRKRLADLDGLSGKAAIDGLVAAGILADDSPEQVAEIHHKQSQGSAEKTIIEIEEIEAGGD